MDRGIVAYVVSSLLGSGIFLVPVILLRNGVVGMLVMLGISGVFLWLGYLLCSISKPLPEVVKESIGEPMAAIVFWAYWVISWASTSVVVIELINYMGLGQSPYVFFYQTICILLFTFINWFGLQQSVFIEQIITMFKVVPMIFIPIYTIYQLGITPHIPLMGSSVTSSIKESFNSVLWLYVGIESGVLISGKKNCTKEIITGILLVIGIYTINVYALSLSKLSGSLTPYTELLGRLFGPKGKLVLNVIISVICIGTVNAWVIGSTICGEEGANNGFFPSWFGWKNKYGTPYISLLLSNLPLIPILYWVKGSNNLSTLSTLLDLSSNVFLLFYLVCLWSIKDYVSKWNIILLLIMGWFFFIGNLVTPIAFLVSGVPIYFLKQWQLW